jgi:hypothetical protein
MSSVDDRIVNMQFNNKQFTQGASDSQKALENLEAALGNAGSGGGLDKMAAGVDNVSSRFGALKVAAIASIATIATRVTNAGIEMVKSMTLDPIMAGFKEYETNLNSIQTIMANTGKKVGVVNTYLNELNHYSDQTIYNFSQMADAIGKFTAAGVKLDPAVSAIKGMANFAALSGAGVQQLNTAMYQMSQALSTGTIRLMDWNSLANAGMGGANMRKVLMETNKTLGDNGVLMDASIKQYGSFRDSLTSGWLTADTFNKSMKVMAGQTLKSGKTVAYTVEQLQKMGYSKDAAKELNKLSQAAIDSATKIKTFTQLIDVVKESIGSGWAKIFQDLFGNFDEATKLWTHVGNVITGSIGGIFKSIDHLLIAWREAGGYTDLWTGFGNIFKTLGNLIHPFVVAFQTLLPTAKDAGGALAGATSGFAAVTGWIEKASRNADALIPVLVTVINAFKTGAANVSDLVRSLAPLLPILSKVRSYISGLASEGVNIASNFIGGLVQGLDASALKDAIINLATSMIDWIKGALGIHSPASTMVPVGIYIVQGIAQGLIDGLSYLSQNMGEIVKTVFEYVGGLFKGFNAMDWTSLFNGILTGSLLVMAKKTMEFVDTWKGFGNNMQGIFDELGNSMKAWQNSLKSKMILEIALAVGILAASIIALSMVNPKKLAIGLGAVTVMMGVLSGTLLALSKIESDKQMAILATSLLVISAAMIQFSTAVVILGKQDMKTLEKGIASFAIVLGLVTGALLALSATKGTAAGSAAAVIGIATAIVILTSAIAIFGNMDLMTLVKGIGAMALVLGLLTGSLLALGLVKTTPAAGAAMILMATAITILTSAVAIFGNMDLKTLAKGLGAVAIGLTLMTVSLLALGAMGPAVLAGGAAMLLLSTAMLQMSAVILVLGAAPWSVLGKGILFMALALTVFIAAGFAAIAAAPGLLALGVAVGLVGAGMALAGVGMLAFATGLAVLATVGTAATAVIIAAIHAFLALLPAIAQQAAAAFVAFIKVIANASGEIRKAFGTIFKNILGVITDNIPAIGKLMSKLITTAIKVIKKAVPQFVEAGFTIIDKFIASAAKHVPSIAEQGTNLVVALVTAIGDNGPKIVDAAFKAIIKFINGLADAIDDNVSDLRDAGLNLAHSIVNGLTGGLLDYGIQKVKDAVDALMDHIPGWAKKMLGINSPSKRMIPIGEGVVEGMIVGMVGTFKHALETVSEMADKIIAAGNDAVLTAARAATKAQKKAYAIQAKADIAAEEARDAAAYARQHKKDKAAQKRAKELQKAADAQQKKADQAQSAADKANQNVTNVQDFQNADLHGKGDIKDQQAVALADRADKMLAKANAEAARARELMKTNRKAGLEMLKQARKDAKEAAALEQKARDAHKKAQEYYGQEVKDRIAAMEADSAAATQAAADQAAYDAADAQGKSDILKARAAADQATAEAAKKKAADLVAEAKAIADTDAAKAMKLLDEAAVQTEAAKTASDKAAQELADAASVLNDSSASASSSSSTTPSSSILEQAASAIDRYTTSLQEATDLAAAQSGPVQFTQNNYSPEALSPSEVYRQTRNLISAAEVKMG